MKLTIYSVNPADRPWDDWLDPYVTDSRHIDRENYYDPRWYQGPGRFLTLIHFSSQLKEGATDQTEEIDKNWGGLESGIRQRVFWFIYSGSGYSKMETSHSKNIHYFYYPIDRDFFTAEDRTRFQNFLRALENLEHIDKTIWKILKPAGNVHAATVLAILSGESAVDITSAVDSLIIENDTISNAHHEFSARLPEGTRPPILNAWKTALRKRNYREIRDQLSAVFGALPD